MVPREVCTRIVTDNGEDATQPFVCEAEERDYELALFMAPAPIEDPIAWAGGSAPRRIGNNGRSSPAEAGTLLAEEDASDALTTDPRTMHQLRLHLISSK